MPRTPLSVHFTTPFLFTFPSASVLLRCMNPLLTKIIYELKDEHIELLYFLYIRDYSTQKLAAMRNQSDRNIRRVRSTVLGQIEKKVLLVLADRLGQDFPFTGEERDFLSRHAKDLPTALEKLDKEKIALIKKIGGMVRKIARERAKLETKQDKNNANDKKAV